MKQREISAQSSIANGGDRRVFDNPGVGVLQMIATATLPSCSFKCAKLPFHQDRQDYPSSRLIGRLYEVRFKDYSDDHLRRLQASHLSERRDAALS